MEANAISSPAATDAMRPEASSTALLVMTAISHGCMAKSKQFSAVAKWTTRTLPWLDSAVPRGDDHAAMREGPW